MSEDNTQKEGTFDMGSVTAEDPVTATAPISDGSASSKPARTRRTKGENAGAVSDGTPKEPAAPKAPTVGEYGKRGLPAYTVSLTDVAFEGDAAKHHQRKVIYNILAGSENRALPFGEIVTAIEGDAHLLQAMNTNQSIMKCVAYQVNELVKHGVCVADKPVRAKAEKKEAEAPAAVAEASAESAEPVAAEAEATA